MGDAHPLATAVLQSMLAAAASDVALLSGCKAPNPARHTLALQRMLTAVRRSARTRNPAVNQATYVAIEPDSAGQATQTDRDISGFDGHTRSVSSQQALAVRQQREALAAQKHEHRMYRRALQKIVQTIEELRSQHESLAANAECVWRLARSRGVLGDGADPHEARPSAWSGSLQLPQGFGHTAELDIDNLVA
jgi:hypothetical protein